MRGDTDWYKEYYKEKFSEGGHQAKKQWLGSRPWEHGSLEQQ